MSFVGEAWQDQNNFWVPIPEWSNRKAFVPIVQRLRI